MSIHNETMDKTTVIKVEGSEPSVSQEPVPPGTYPCVVIKSSYDETSRECVYDADQMLVRPVRDNKTGIESPVTPEERSKGFSVHPSGTYIWLLLKVTTPDGEHITSVRPNWINKLRPPNSDRECISQVREAIGVSSVPLVVGQAVEALHDRPFLVKLRLKKKMGYADRMENELAGALPLATSSMPPGFVTAAGAEVVDTVWSSSPPIEAYEGKGNKWGNW